MIANHTIARVDNARLQKGAEGLTSGDYSITVTRYTEDEISAQVTKRDGTGYPVTLTAKRAFCGCPDNQFRGKTCRHAVTLALYAIRTPQPEARPIDLSLAKVRHFEDAPF